MDLSLLRSSVTLALPICLIACGGGTSAPAATTAPEPEAALDQTRVTFEDATEEAGLDFTHVNGMSGEMYFNEMVGAGVALFDYDNDGDLDVYLVQGHILGPDVEQGDASFEPGLQGRLRDRLYRNATATAPSGSMQLPAVTETSGIDAPGYGMGVAAGDYDHAGWGDLYVLNYGPNQLWRNNGDGTFTDVTARAGADDARWSVSGSFLDYDRDGWLDLYIGNYVNYSVANNVECFNNIRTYCGPDGFVPVPDRLFRNRGDGTFEDTTAASQIGREYGPALGVSTADLDGNGIVGVPDLLILITSLGPCPTP